MNNANNREQIDKFRSDFIDACQNGWVANVSSLLHSANCPTGNDFREMLFSGFYGAAVCFQDDVVKYLYPKYDMYLDAIVEFLELCERGNSNLVDYFISLNHPTLHKKIEHNINSAIDRSHEYKDINKQLKNLKKKNGWK